MPESLTIFALDMGWIAKSPPDFRIPRAVAGRTADSYEIATII